MIINKIYEVNLNDMDSIVTAMAKDIEEGYTIYKFERLPMNLCTNAIDTMPAMIFTLHNKKADLDCEKAGWL